MEKGIAWFLIEILVRKLLPEITQREELVQQRVLFSFIFRQARRTVELKLVDLSAFHIQHYHWISMARSKLLPFMKHMLAFLSGKCLSFWCTRISLGLSLHVRLSLCIFMANEGSSPGPSFFHGSQMSMEIERLQSDQDAILSPAQKSNPSQLSKYVTLSAWTFKSILQHMSIPSALIPHSTQIITSCHFPPIIKYFVLQIELPKGTLDL